MWTMRRELLRRVRWGTVGLACGALLCLVAVIAWPRLVPAGPRLPADAARPLVAERPAVTPRPHRTAPDAQPSAAGEGRRGAAPGARGRARDEAAPRHEAGRRREAARRGKAARRREAGRRPRKGPTGSRREVTGPRGATPPERAAPRSPGRR